MQTLRCVSGRIRIQKKGNRNMRHFILDAFAAMATGAMAETVNTVTVTKFHQSSTPS